MIVISWKLKEYLTFREACLFSFLSELERRRLDRRLFVKVKLSCSTSVDLFIFLLARKLTSIIPPQKYVITSHLAVGGCFSGFKGF